MEHVLTPHFGITPATDRRSPEPTEDLGIHPAELTIAITGPAGAITLNINTGWHLPTCNDCFPPGLTNQAYPISIGCHKRHQTGQHCNLINDNCIYYWTDTGAEELYELLLTKGSGPVLHKLEQLYYEQLYYEQLTIEPPTAGWAASPKATDNRVGKQKK